MFQYVNHLDAVGTLYQEACVRWVDALREGKNEEAERWSAACFAIKAAWPELCAVSVGRTETSTESGDYPSDLCVTINESRDK